MKLKYVHPVHEKSMLYESQPPESGQIDVKLQFFAGFYRFFGHVVKTAMKMDSFNILIKLLLILQNLPSSSVGQAPSLFASLQISEAQKFARV